MSVASPSRPAPPTPAPATPRAGRLRAGRRDLRLAAGVALVVLSVVLGSRILAAAGDREQVWSLAAPLAAGTTLQADDLVAVPVALDDLAAYVPASTDVVGQVLRRDAAAGELLPASALGDAGAVDLRWVTVPVDPLHAPPGLARGERVDVYVTPSDGAAVGAGVQVLPSLVLPGVLVDDPGSSDASGVTDLLGVVLEVPASDADRAVAAARAGDVDLVRVGG
ncbi:MAG: SAF domain-containing protein [Candidatus Nanopelagicales bacterium]